jgi:hypothetical protein
MWENPMADSLFDFLAILGNRAAAGALRLNRPVASGVVSSIASSPGGLSDFFLKGTKSAVAAKDGRLTIPASKTSCTLPTSVTIRGYGMESELLALVHNPGAKVKGFGEECPVPYNGAAESRAGIGAPQCA